MILSIIIPLYNTENYIGRCIQSCIDQSYDKKLYEIIIVNDGSTDKSLEIAKSFEKTYENIIIITQDNQKQGAARNNGLKVSQGEYIWFVDSDDWIEPDAIKEIAELFEYSNLDIIRFDAIDHTSKQSTLRICNHKPKYTYLKHEILIENEFSVCVPFHIFKKQFLIENKFSFLENIFFEDSEFMIKVVEKCNSFYYLNKPFYNVLKREESTTRTTNYTRFLDLILVIKSHINYLETNNFDNQIVKVFSIHISRNMNSLLFGSAKSGKTFLTASESLRKIENLKKYIIFSGSLFHQIEFLSLKYPAILRRLLLIFYHGL